MTPLSFTDPLRQARVTHLRDAAAAGHAAINGIIGVELGEDATGAIILTLPLIFPAASSGAAQILPADVVISGGVRRPVVRVLSVVASGATLRITVAERGDFSTYTIALSRDGAPPPGFDPLLSSGPFSFRAECARGFDCQTDTPAAADPLPIAPVDYLARDYEGFRRLMLDRMATLRPAWRDTGPASVDVTLTEMLAYLADRLSYQQDAIATEAYLDTCRLRASAKRHARLVDYVMHDGMAARAFVHIRLRVPATGATHVTIRAGAEFLTQSAGLALATAEAEATRAARQSGAVSFRAMADGALHSPHNRMIIHDYLGAMTILPKGATSAALQDAGRTLTLHVGDWVVFEEVLDPDTGNASPDPARRHVVRLTKLTLGSDPIGQLDGANVPVPLDLLHIEWGEDDALPLAMPLQQVVSSDAVDGVVSPAKQPSLIARGNLIPVEQVALTQPESGLSRPAPGYRRARVALRNGPVAFTAPVAPESSAAAFAMPDIRTATPVMRVTQSTGVGSDTHWPVVSSFLDHDAGQQGMMLDVEGNGSCVLVTGNGSDAPVPHPDVPLRIHYGLSRGAGGNVGAEVIGHLVSSSFIGLDGLSTPGMIGQDSDIVAIRNPMPATGGLSPESIGDVRLKAPMQFRDLARAVSLSDYVTLVTRHADVDQAKAIERWQGSWRVIILILDLRGGRRLTDTLEQDLREFLEPYRLAGHVLEFRQPDLVPVSLDLLVCIAHDRPRDAVERDLRALFSSRLLPDGTQGIFHPDRFSFGDPVRLSHLYAAGQGIAGVRHMTITRLSRQGVTDNAALEHSELILSDYEIAVLDNDPNFPDRGQVHIAMEGGI